MSTHPNDSPSYSPEAEAKRLAFLNRPRPKPHAWSCHHGRGPKRSKSDLARIDAEHKRLIARWLTQHPGQEIPPTKLRSLYANASCIVTFIKTPRFRAFNNAKHLYLSRTRKIAQAAAVAEAAKVEAAANPPKPVRRSRWSLDGV